MGAKAATSHTSLGALPELRWWSLTAAGTASSQTNGRKPMKTLAPSEFYLGQNYPNPFSGKTTIKFCVPHRTPVKVAVCNCESKMVRRLVDEEKEAGTYEVEFDGVGLSEGSYICILQAGAFVQSRTMLLLK